MNTEVTTKIKWSIRDLLALTTLVAILSAASLWLGKDYGLLATMPTLLTGFLLYATRGKVLIGAIAGTIVFVILALTVAVQFNRADPRFIKATILLGLFGAVFGASIHSMWLKRYLLGSVGFALGIISLALISMMSTSVEIKPQIPPTIQLMPKNSGTRAIDSPDSSALR